MTTSGFPVIMPTPKGSRSEKRLTSAPLPSMCAIWGLAFLPYVRATLNAAAMFSTSKTSPSSAVWNRRLPQRNAWPPWDVFPRLLPTKFASTRHGRQGLARLVPLEEDEKRLVHIVSRESERLNNIITDFLNYSREKTYEFQEADVRSLLDE